MDNFGLGMIFSSMVTKYRDLKYLLKSPKNNSIENTTNSINTEQNIFMISGCKDNQTSADFFNSATNKFAGALTTAFLNTSTKLKKRGELRET